MSHSSHRSRWLRITLACVALAWHAGAVSQQSDSVVPLSALPKERIVIETRSARRHVFEAWRAESAAARAQGFMFVPDSAVRPDQAMIFIYEPPQRVGMWMKNTLLSLDMLFVDARGCIVTIMERARPGSLVTIDSRVPVTVVVELKAGTVAERGIGTGDRVTRIDKQWPRGQQNQSCG